MRKSSAIPKRKKWIEELKPQYNLGAVGGGDNISNHPNHEKICERKSDILKENWKKQEFREKQMNRLNGDTNPNWRGGVSKCKCEVCNKDISYNSKRCSKCSKIGERNPFFNKRHSDKTKEKLSKSHKGKEHSKETKEKLKNIAKSRLENEDFREKTNAARLRGKYHPFFGKERNENVKVALANGVKKAWGNLEHNLERIKNMLSRAVLAENKLFLSTAKAAEFYGMRVGSMGFRCKSKDEKWKNFQYVDYDFVLNNLDKIEGDYTTTSNFIDGPET